MSRILTYAQAVSEALDQSMENDPSVFVIGLGVSDRAATFGSTKGLVEKYGTKRVIDAPVSENALTGICLGAAITGMRPVMTHIRLEFAMLAMDQIANQAAKWHYMFGGRAHAPMVIRMIVGRGWGQGSQHSQSLHAWFTHIPGLKVIMPSTPYDAKGMMMSAIKDNNPVISIEHRWVYNIKGEVPEDPYYVTLGEPRLLKEGKDVTIVTTSYMGVEAVKAFENLKNKNISADIIDVRTLSPLDDTLIINSVKKTGRLIVADLGCKTSGYAGEVITRVVEKGFSSLKKAPIRLTVPDIPTPTTRALANFYYPLAQDIENAVYFLLDKKEEIVPLDIKATDPLDVPDASFTGPY